MKPVYASVSAAVLALFLASPAHAADIHRDSIKDGPDVAVDLPARTWTGLWIAALGGYQMDTSKYSAEHSFTSEKFSSHEEQHLDGLGNGGLFGEIQLGFDRQVGSRLVVGAFGGLNLDDSKFHAGGSAGSSIPDSGYKYTELEYEKKWGGVVGPRLGFLTSPNTMLYVAGGWAFGEIGRARGGEDGKLADLYGKQDTDLNGLFGELGLETRLKDLGENVYFKLAGRYTDYDALKLDHQSESGEGWNCANDLKLDRDELTVMGGLTIKVGGNLPSLGY